MADFNTTGIDALRLSLEEVANIPDDVLLDMLMAEGNVVKEHQRNELLKSAKTHQLEKSITVSRRFKRSRTGEPVIYVYPDGVRDDGKTRNAEVGYILEYGAPGRGLEPTSWMWNANEAAADEAAQAAAEIYGSWLDSKGL